MAVRSKGPEQEVGSKYFRLLGCSENRAVGRAAQLRQVNQPALHACFRAGFVLDGLEELVFDERVEARRPLGWGKSREIQPVLIARMRL